MFQACDSGWRCDIKCCAFFPLVSIPCFCDQRERNLTGDVLPSASRQCSVRLQQSAHVFVFSLLSSSTVPVCWSCADSSTHLHWLKTSSWWKKTRCNIAGKGEKSLQHYNLVHKISYASSCENSCSKSSGGEGMGKIGENFGVEPDKRQK